MNILDVSKLHISFGFGPVLSELSFSMNEGDRLSIVGQNGCGKTTLLNIIAGTEAPDGGSVSIKKGTKLAFLRQTVPDMHDERVVLDLLKDEFKGLYAQEAYLRDLEQQLNTCTNEAELDALVHNYSRLSELFLEAGGYDIDATIAYVTNGLKLPQRLLTQHYNTLSGGEKTLVHFAKILLSKPDLLLLDEPTNHLDIERVEWLEQYLSRYKGSVIVVSHDRYFLDRISKKVLEIENKTGTLYHGNYTSYVQQKEESDLKQFNDYKNEQKKIAAMEETIAKLKDWGERGDNPTLFRRAAAIERRLNELQENATQKPLTVKPLPLQFVANNRSSNDVAVWHNFNLSIGNLNLLANANASVHYNEKVALVGNNGSGKTTLLKTLLGLHTEFSGELKLGPNIQIGYLPQLLTFENGRESVLDHFHYNTGHHEEASRKILSRFQFFSQDIYKSVGNLSGGEKIRLKLAVMLQKPVNTLVFDEPTNHIDIITREVLEETLKAFKGAVLFVSHDRYFINNVATKVLELRDKTLFSHQGNYDDFKGINKQQPPTDIAEKRTVKKK